MGDHVELVPLEDIHGADCVIMAVDHAQYKELGVDALDAMYGEGEKVFVDVKGLVSVNELEVHGYRYWRL